MRKYQTSKPRGNLQKNWLYSSERQRLRVKDTKKTWDLILTIAINGITGTMSKI